jgi:hypothetical protein
MNSAFKTALFLALCLLGGCALGPGTGTETTNGNVMGAIYLPDGSPAMQVGVTLLPADFDPVAGGPVPSALTDTTDELGRYEFKSPESGLYTIEAAGASRDLKGFIFSVSVDTFSRTVVPNKVINATGSIRVLTASPGDTVDGYYYIPGTTLYTHAGSSASVFNSVAPGEIPAVYYGNRTDPSRKRLVNSATVVPAGRVVAIADYATLSNSQNLLLNTTASGAGVQGNVLDFPVLVRLTSTNFDFSGAMRHGEDIRFTKSDNMPLSFEIERWDSAAGAAEIWVRVDTVFGNDIAHFIVMHWGATAGSATVSASNSAAVFDTAAGFQGVWHCAQPGGATTRDATANHYDGTPSPTPTTDAGGMIGPAQAFNGTSNFFTMPGTSSSRLNFPEHGVYAASAWVYTNILDSAYRMIVSKGDYQYNLEIMDSNSWEFAECEDVTGFNVTKYPATAKTWAFVTGVRNGNSQYLYIDGLCLDSTIEVLSPGTVRSTTNDLTIGRKSYPAPFTYFFDGIIDEVRIYSVAPSADWLKLCYMNQKPKDDLVVFK